MLLHGLNHRPRIALLIEVVGGLAPVGAALAAQLDRLGRRLGHRLTEVARFSETREWSTGTFYSGWFLAQAANREALLAAWARPSLVIGRHLVDSARARAA